MSLKLPVANSRCDLCLTMCRKLTVSGRPMGQYWGVADCWVSSPRPDAVVPAALSDSVVVGCSVGVVDVMPLVLVVTDSVEVGVCVVSGGFVFGFFVGGSLGFESSFLLSAPAKRS